MKLAPSRSWLLSLPFLLKTLSSDLRACTLLGRCRIYTVQREWDRDLALKMATTGMFRPAPGVPNKLGGLTEFTNDRVYMESLHWADAKDYTNKMLRVAARKWNPKSDPGFMADVKTRLQGAFDAELKNGFKNGFSPQKKPWSEFSSIPRMREKALMIEEAE